jgi:hypothetical protein
MEGWTTALDTAANYGLVPLLFVLLLYWHLKHMDRRILAIERILANVNNVDQRLLKQLHQEWGPYIGTNPPLRVSTEQARKLIDIGLKRDTFDILAYIARDILWDAREVKEETLRDKLRGRLWDVLKRTREFFGLFTTEKGNLRSILDEKIPLTKPDGEARGDELFRDLLDDVIAVVRSRDKQQSILTRVEGIATRRRQETENLMFSWLGA